MQKLDPRQTCRRPAPDTLRRRRRHLKTWRRHRQRSAPCPIASKRISSARSRFRTNAYYGVQTLRGKENFHITGIPMSLEPNFVKAFGYVKKAAALANRDLGVLDAKIADAIAGACDRLIARRDARPVRHRLHPGRRRHLDQHERERGDRQSRARAARPQEGRIPVSSTRTTTSTSASRPTTSIRRRSASR